MPFPRDLEFSDDQPCKDAPLESGMKNQDLKMGVAQCE